MATSQTRIITILAGILLAVVVASLALVWLLPSSPTSPAVSSNSAATTPNQTDTATFKTDVFQGAPYVSLDKQMIQDGRLPVQPPAGVGKPNPFQ